MCFKISIILSYFFAFSFFYFSHCASNFLLENVVNVTYQEAGRNLLLLFLRRNQTFYFLFVFVVHIVFLQLIHFFLITKMLIVTVKIWGSTESLKNRLYWFCHRDNLGTHTSAVFAPDVFPSLPMSFSCHHKDHVWWSFPLSLTEPEVTQRVSCFPDNANISMHSTK